MDFWLANLPPGRAGATTVLGAIEITLSVAKGTCQRAENYITTVLRVLQAKTKHVRKKMERVSFICMQKLSFAYICMYLL